MSLSFVLADLEKQVDSRLVHLDEPYTLEVQGVVAEEIEDPFGGDTNDLPMKSIAKNIHKHVSEIFSVDSQK